MGARDVDRDDEPWEAELRNKIRARIAKLTALAENMDISRGTQWNKLMIQLFEFSAWVGRPRCEKCGKESRYQAYASKGWFFHGGSFSPKSLCPECVAKTPATFFEKAAAWLYPWASHGEGKK